MSLRNELGKEQCYEVKPDTPTLTVELDDRKIMLPYATFHRAELVADQLVAFFGEVKLVIKGRNLEKLWENLQLYEVRVVRKSKLASKHETLCLIKFIEIADNG